MLQRSWNGWLGCLVGAAMGIGMAATGARADGTGAAPPAFAKDEVARKIGVRDYALVDIPPGLDVSQPVQVKARLGGVERTLSLTPKSVRGANFHALEQRADGQVYEVKAPPETTFRGTVDGDPHTVVAGGTMDDGMYAEVMLADGTTYGVQPVSQWMPGAPKGLHAVYTHDDVLPGPWHCGNTEVAGAGGSGAAGAAGGSPFGPRGSVLYTAQLSTDADFEYFSRYGGTAAVNQRIALIVNIMNVQYERETDITHVLFTTLVRTAEPDPYTSTDSGTLLNQFRADWNANRPSSLGDLAQLFTGKELDGNTIGLSFVAVVCGANGYGLNQSDFNNNLMSATDLIAHETGHEWSASHCTCSGSGSTISTMNPFITSINRFTFSNNTNTIGEIVGHRNSRSCLTTGSGGLDPRNDLCGNAVPIGANTLIGWNNAGAGNDGGTVPCTLITTDIWYTYVSPCDGTITVTTCGSNFDTVLAAYSGSCGALTLLACGDDNSACTGSTLSSLISWNGTRGTLYYIRAAGYNGATGDGLLTVSQSCAPPANDDCGNATTIGQGSFPFVTNAATTDGPLETTLCNAASNSQISQDVWFRYVGQCAGTVRLGTCGSFDTKIAVYAGGCPSGPNTAIACNDDNGPACTGLNASVDFTASPGTAYLIRVGGYQTAVGAGTLTVNAFNCPAPVNDGCAGAINVSAGGTFNGTNLGAFTDGVSACGTGGFNDVFYTFVSPSAGQLTATTCGTHDTGGVDLGVDTILSVHTACPASTANQIACDDDWPSSTLPTACNGQDQGNHFDSAVQASVAAGQLVYIRLAQYSSGGVSGPVRLNVSFTAAGACCCGSTCSVTTQPGCSGAFQGAGAACNPSGNNTSPCCRADFDHSGTVTVQDIFGFLTAWFANSPCADTNQVNGLTVQDIFDYLSAFFAGC